MMIKEGYFLFFGGIMLGFGIGFAVARKVLDQKYFKKYDERAKELEEYYGMLGEYDREITDDMNKETASEKQEEGVLSKDQRDDIRKKLLRNEQQTTSYASMYKKKKEERRLETEHPEEDEPEDEEENPGEVDDERAFDEHLRDRKRPPRIISAEAIWELGPEWEEQTLLYYMYDEIVTTEDGDIIQNEELLIGDCLYKFGFSENDEMAIYVQNFAYTTVYEVQKVMARYEG